MISLTPVAIEKIKSALAEQEDDRGLRIAVKGSGCSGLQYKMTMEKVPVDKDEVLHIDGIKFFVDNRSLVYLRGTRIDYVDREEGSGFKFENPYTTPSCGCGDTFEV